MDRAQIRRLASLARLALGEEEFARLEKDLEHILGHFRALDSLDVSGIEPSPYAIPTENVFREDVPREEPAPDVLASAPDREGAFFRVPSILHEEAGRGPEKPGA